MPWPGSRQHIAGLIVDTAQVSVAEAQAGTGLDLLDVIAAVVIGGASLSGGVGRMGTRS